MGGGVLCGWLTALTPTLSRKRERGRCKLTPEPSPANGRGEAGGSAGFVAGGGLVAVVPPAEVPEALEEALRVVVGVPGDEVDVAAQGLFQESERTLARAVGWESVHGGREVAGQLEDHAGSRLGFEEEEVGE